MNCKNLFFNFAKYIFVFLFLFGNFSNTIFAQTFRPTSDSVGISNGTSTPTVNFEIKPGQSIKEAAQNQCNNILQGKGIESAYSAGSIDMNSLVQNYTGGNIGSGGGGSTVPTIDQTSIAVLKAIFNSSESSNQISNKAWGELMRLNFGLFCVQATKMAEAVEAAKEYAAKIARSDYANQNKDPNKILEAINKETCLEVVNNREKLGLSDEESRAAATYCSDMVKPVTREVKKDPKIANDIATNGPNNGALDLIRARNNSSENIYMEVKSMIDSRIAQKKSTVVNDYNRTGVVGLYLCKKTYSGKDESKVRWYESDCKEWTNSKPAELVLAENKKAFVDLPFDVLLGPPGVLGEDKEITNIVNRLNSGVAGEMPWEQQGIYSNFAQSNGGNPYFANVNTGGGGNNLGITTGVGTNGGTSINEIKSASQTKDEILKNLNLTIAMYNLAKTYYASTTSLCAVLPLAKRVETIAKIEEAKAPIEKRKD
jgi:hypothetical protein